MIKTTKNSIILKLEEGQTIDSYINDELFFHDLYIEYVEDTPYLLNFMWRVAYPLSGAMGYDYNMTELFTKLNSGEEVEVYALEDEESDRIIKISFE